MVSPCTICELAGQFLIQLVSLTEDFVLAVGALVVVSALAGVPVQPVGAGAPVEAGAAGALVHLGLTARTFEAGRALGDHP